jgi:tetratricopeptide (TPR) repeat protein
MSTLCDAETLKALVAGMTEAPGDQIPRLAELIGAFPEDARLHFLLGSALAGEGRHIEAHASLSRAVALAPDFAIARFQLGLFELTSGEAANALQTWGRLDLLPDGHYLRKLVDGLRALIRDDFDGAIEGLRQGIALNQENPPLNRDMQMLIDKCLEVIASSDDDSTAGSETALILSQFSDRRRPH